MYSLKDIKIGLNDLVTFQFQLNTAQLFSVLQTIIDTINAQERTINNVELKMSNILSSIQNHEEHLTKLLAMSNLNSTSDSMMDDTVSDIRKDLDQALDDVNELKNQYMNIQEERSMETERIKRDVEECRRTQFQDRLSAQKQNDEIKKLREHFMSQQEQVHQKLLLLNELNIPELTETLLKECKTIIDETNKQTTSELRITQERCLNNEESLKGQEKDLKKLQSQFPTLRQKVSDMIDQFKEDTKQRFEDNENEIKQNNHEVHTLYKIFHIDVNVVNQFITQGVEPSPTLLTNTTSHSINGNNSQNKSITPPGILLEEIPRQDRVQEGRKKTPTPPPLLKSKTPPITTYRRPITTASSIPTGTQTSCSPTSPRPISSMSNVSDIYSDILVNVLLKTPAFTKLKEDMMEMIESVEQRAMNSIQKNHQAITDNLQQMDKDIEDRVTHHQLKKFIESNDILQGISKKVNDHDVAIDVLKRESMPQEKVYAALKLKSDAKETALKADRKVVNSLFDYLNEKFNTLSSNNGENQEALLRAVKHLESEIQQITEMQERKSKNINSQQNTPTQFMGGNAPTGFHYHPFGMETCDDEESNSNNNPYTLARYKCLSCNRPAGNLYDPKTRSRVFWNESQSIPPNSMPTIVSKPSLRNIDPHKRLESYYHWLQGEQGVAQDIINTSINSKAIPDGSKDILAGGFNIHPQNEKPISRGSQSVKDSQNLNVNNVSGQANTKAPPLNLNKIDQSLNSVGPPPPPKTAPGGARNRDSIPHSARSRIAPFSSSSRGSCGDFQDEVVGKRHTPAVKFNLSDPHVAEKYPSPVIISEHDDTNANTTKLPIIVNDTGASGKDEEGS